MSEARANGRQWTEDQRAAIEHVGGDLLVSAAAGSGKTAVLAERCARLVAGGHCGVEELLVLTFTDAAANEMRARIAAALRARVDEARGADIRRLEKQAAMVERASISTLHAFCARILRQHFHAAGIDPAFELIDEEEADLLRQEVLGDLLTKWHRGTPAGSGAGPVSAAAAGADPEGAAGENFAAFYEAYGQGRDSAVGAMIEKVYHMLASSADPAGWRRAALGAYGAERGETLERLARETAAHRVRMLADAGERACALVRAEIGGGQMLTELEKLRERAGAMAALLSGRGFAAWDEARGMAQAGERITIKTVKEVASFPAIKERTWEQLKKAWKAMHEDLFAVDAATLDGDLRATEIHVRTLLALVEEFSANYAAAKRRQNCLDFSDLERLALDLLTAPQSLAARELRQRYRHILVDEFQDINPLQAALLEAVRSTERFAEGNLFVVGDVKQSIYGFRLADPNLFLAREAAARKTGREAYVPLSTNFRSRPALLAIMNGVFGKLLTRAVAGLDYADGHALEPPGAAPAGPQPAGAQGLIPFTGAPAELHLVAMDGAGDEADEDFGAEEGGEAEADEGGTRAGGAGAAGGGERPSTVEAEAEVVAARIKGLMGEGRGLARRDGTVAPLRHRDIAILLRSMKNKALVFARALARAGIPVHADLSTGYFEAPEVRDVLAVLQILDNPLQDIPLATALLSPFGRFNYDELAAIRLAYDRQTVPFALAAARYAEDVQTPGASANSSRDPALAGRLGAFFERVAVWRTWTRTQALHEALGAIYAASHIVAYLSGLEAGPQRVANLQMLHQRALQFAGFRKQGLHRFLRFLERLREQEGDFGAAPVLSEASDVVRIMSVHKSKGLEFPVVFVSGLGGGFNLGGDGLKGGGGVAVHRDRHLGMKAFDGEREALFPTAASLAIGEAQRRAARAEELRLLYVALTRAREHLVLTGTIRKAGKIAEARGAWSGFGGALPEDVLLKGGRFLDWILPALAMGGAGDLRVGWPGEECVEAQVRVELHAAEAQARAVGGCTASGDAAIENLLAGRPLQASDSVPEAPGDRAAETLALRVTGTYPHAALAGQPAVLTVTELKKYAGETREPDEITGAALPGGRRMPLAEAGDLDARARGIATHRLLELLDFAALAPPRASALEAEIARVVAAGALAPEQKDSIDCAAVLWFLGTDLGRELAGAARNRPQDLRREIPFVWICPDAVPQAAERPADPRDWPTIRGVIDVLLIERNGDAPSLRSAPIRRVRIIDYKTDSPGTWQLHLPEYRQQMRYYLQAARDILAGPVEEATLVFLTARQLEVVTL